jgi:hypothetical protein
MMTVVFVVRRKWQEEHNRYLDEKTAKESDANMKTREKAREAYDQFLQQRQKLKDGNKKANRFVMVARLTVRSLISAEHFACCFWRCGELACLLATIEMLRYHL